MEPEVVEDDFQRFQKENHDKWKLIDESLEKCLEIDGQGESVSFQVKKRIIFTTSSLSTSDESIILNLLQFNYFTAARGGIKTAFRCSYLTFN